MEEPDMESAKSRLTVSEKENPSASELRLYQQLTPWLLDLGSLLLSLACVIAVIALLVRYDNQPAPTWDHVTFNTVISVLATVAQIALSGPIANAISQLKWSWFWNTSKPKSVKDFQSYDAASRGPLGAVSMLFHFIQRPVTSVGALLTIVALATHPFLQNSQTTYLRTVKSSEPSTIARATNFAGASLDLSGTDSGNSYFIPDSGSKGAFYAGLFNVSNGLNITPSCPSGNCTWAPYTSLGMCSACSDVTSTANSTMVDGYDTTDLQWMLPNGMTAEASLASMTVETSLTTMRFERLQRYSVVDLFAAFFLEEEYVDLDPDTPPVFTECILYFCVNTYVAGVSNGQPTERLLHSFPNATTSQVNARKGLRLSPNSTMSNSTTVPLHPTGQFDTISSNTTITPPGDSERYTVDDTTLVVLREWIQGTLLTQIAANAANSVSGSNSDVAQVLYTQTGGLNGTMSRIASSMTAQIRSLTGETASGTTQVVQNYVAARWGWVVLPLAVLALTLAFIITTMAIGIAKSIPTWRSSTLPTLVFSLDHPTAGAIARQGPRLSAMETEAKQFAIAMSRDHDTWCLEGMRVEHSGRGSSGGRRPFWVIPRRK